MIRLRKNKKEVGVMKDLLIFEIDGMDKKEILEGLGFLIDENGYLYRDGKPILSKIDNTKVKVEDVEMIVPGSLEVLSDPIEVSDYFSDLE
jgi:hypothetical protein